MKGIMTFFFLLMGVYAFGQTTYLMHYKISIYGIKAPQKLDSAKKVAFLEENEPVLTMQYIVKASQDFIKIIGRVKKEGEAPLLFSGPSRVVMYIDKKEHLLYDRKSNKYYKLMDYTLDSGNFDLYKHIKKTKSYVLLESSLPKEISPFYFSINSGKGIQTLFYNGNTIIELKKWKSTENQINPEKMKRIFSNINPGLLSVFQFLQ